MNHEDIFMNKLGELLSKHKVAICSSTVNSDSSEVFFQFHDMRDGRSHKQENVYTGRLHVKQHDLVGLVEQQERERKNDVLQRLCTEVCNHKPILFWDNKEAKPWSCMLTAQDDGDEWYCDECPTQDMCPHPNKAWSK